ncbi:MAG: hypothetical protein IT462_14330 [Planctomycetes bacterium]|nr:hypothetical protein [Planctomycetota bacterium]
MKKRNPREMMELAIEEMRKSVQEPRADGKATPKVGAVLVKPDGNIETAHRGELRHGDHAEYTLLERKNRNTKLDGSTLFATLEPCAKESRRYPKLPCAERIVLARIKDVWIGIEDPDPTVDRKGIKYMQDAGIKVHMFDRDLQDTIRDENKLFLAQALERAADAEELPKQQTLSTLEEKLEMSRLEDLSDEAVEAYRSIAKIPEDPKTTAFKLRFALQGLLKEDDGSFKPTGFGLVLFGKNPRRSMPQTGLLATLHYVDGTEETRDFDGPQVLVPEQALNWLREKLPNPIDRTRARRREVNESLFELVREGIVNALVHRDYDVQGAKCQLVVTADKIEIHSPGRPVDPITLEQMQSFSAPMLSRNPVLHYVFAQMELAEERGLGLKSMQTGAEKAGLPRPKYTWKAPYLVLTLYRTAESANSTLSEDVQKQMSSAEGNGWRWLTQRGGTTALEYAKAMKLSDRAARLHLTKFVRLGLARKVGSARSTAYKVV